LKNQAAKIFSFFTKVNNIFNIFCPIFFIDFHTKIFFSFYPLENALGSICWIMKFQLVLNHFRLIQTAFWSTILALYHLTESGNPQEVPPWLVKGEITQKEALKGLKRLKKGLIYRLMKKWCCFDVQIVYPNFITNFNICWPIFFSDIC
jgi:hypothetical protein